MNERALGGLLLVTAGVLLLWGVFHGWFDGVVATMSGRLGGKTVGPTASGPLFGGSRDPVTPRQSPRGGPVAS